MNAPDREKTCRELCRKLCRSQPRAFNHKNQPKGSVSADSKLSFFRRFERVSKMSTIFFNESLGHPLAKGWKLFPDDVRTIRYPEIADHVDMVAGGPRQSLRDFEGPNAGAKPPGALSRRFVAEAGSLIGELQHARELISPIHFGAIGITLGRSDSIAKFFAFSFINQDKRPLDTLADTPFFGSGVYATNCCLLSVP